MLPSVRRAVISTACAAQAVLPKSIAAAAAADYHQRRHSSSSSKPSSSSSSARQPVHGGAGSKSKTKTKGQTQTQPQTQTQETKPAGTAEAAAAAPVGAEEGEAGGPAAAAPSPKPRRRTKAAPATAAATAASAAASVPTWKLPAVPSTSHMTPDFIGLSAFFGMHRPISVTQGLPKAISDRAFASIFEFRASRAGAGGSGRDSDADGVIGTISRAVSRLETSGSGLGGLSEADEDAAAGELIRSIRHMTGGRAARIHIDMASSVPQLLPYHPPPAPAPPPQAAVADAAAADAAAAPAASAAPAEEDEELQQQQQQQQQSAPATRKYQAVFTVEEVTDEEGHIRAFVHSPQILPPGRGLSRSFLGRMALRQLRVEARRDEMLRAISVKRQKKLKMKKKKYKKLQKKLRLENRKLDRT